MSTQEGVPLAKTIKESHDGISGDVPASVNKLYQILPKTTTPDQPWSGSGQSVEFCFPSYLGKVIDCVLQFDIQITTSGAGGDLVLAPSTLFCDRREDVYAGQVFESQDSDQIHMSTLAYLTDQEFNTLRESVNIGEDGSFNTGAPLAVSGTPTTKTFYLPVWSGIFHSVQPFVRGFKDEWRLRFWMAKNGIIQSYSGIDNVTINCTNMALWATEAQLDTQNIASLTANHNQQIVYRGVIQSKFTSAENTVSANGEYRKPLTTFTSDTAALLLFVAPNSSAVADKLTKNALQYVGFLDSGGAEIVQRLPDGLIRNYVQPETVPLSSYLSNPSINKFYVLPFCSNLQRVLEAGSVSGGLRLTGQEQIALLPPTTLSNVVVTAHAYEYAMLNVVKNNCSVIRSSGNPQLRRG